LWLGKKARGKRSASGGRGFSCQAADQTTERIITGKRTFPLEKGGPRGSQPEEDAYAGTCGLVRTPSIKTKQGGEEEGGGGELAGGHLKSTLDTRSVFSGVQASTEGRSPKRGK